MQIGHQARGGGRGDSVQQMTVEKNGGIITGSHCFFTIFLTCICRMTGFVYLSVDLQVVSMMRRVSDVISRADRSTLKDLNW